MSIRSKLAWTFILLLIFGITAISSYSILFIRNYLLDQGEEQIIHDSEWLAITIQNLRVDRNFETNLNEAARTSGYRLAIYDEDGVLFAEVPYNQQIQAQEMLSDSLINRLNQSNDVLLQNRSESEQLITFTIVESTENPAKYLRVSIFKD